MLRNLAAQLLAVRRTHGDVLAATDEAILELFSSSPDVHQAFGLLRGNALEAKWQAFESLPDAEFRAQVEEVITKAAQAAVQALERQRVSVS